MALGDEQQEETIMGALRRTDDVVSDLVDQLGQVGGDPDKRLKVLAELAKRRSVEWQQAYEDQRAAMAGSGARRQRDRAGTGAGRRLRVVRPRTEGAGSAPPIGSRADDPMARTAPKKKRNKTPPAPGESIGSRPDDPMGGELATTREQQVGRIWRKDIKKELHSFLWPDRIPLRYLTLIGGDKGRGKSTVLLSVIAGTTTDGKMPDGTKGVTGAALVIASEDTPGLIEERLQVAGAGSRVAVMKLWDVDGVVRRPDFSRATDIAELRRLVREDGYKLVVIDPLSDFFGKVDLDSEAVRGPLGKLADLAEEEDIAIVLVRNFNKTMFASATNRFKGSTDIPNMCRAVFVVGTDTEDSSRYALACSDYNLGEKPASLSYSFNKVTKTAARIVWHGVTATTAEEVVKPNDAPKRPKQTAAREFLQNYLQQPRSKAEVLREAAQRGMSEETVRRAAKEVPGLRKAKQKDAAGQVMGSVWSIGSSVGDPMASPTPSSQPEPEASDE